MESKRKNRNAYMRAYRKANKHKVQAIEKDSRDRHPETQIKKVCKWARKVDKNKKLSKKEKKSITRFQADMIWEYATKSLK